jgi:hypothetical protein
MWEELPIPGRDFSPGGGGELMVKESLRDMAESQCLHLKKAVQIRMTKILAAETVK